MNRSRKKTGLELLTDALVKLKKQREQEKRQSSFNQYNSVEDRIKREYVDFFTEAADRKKIDDYIRVYKQNNDAKSLFAKLEKEFAGQFKEFEKLDPLCDVRAAFAQQRPSVELEFKDWVANKEQLSAPTRDFEMFNHAFRAAAQCQQILGQQTNVKSIASTIVLGSSAGGRLQANVGGISFDEERKLATQDFKDSVSTLVQGEIASISSQLATLKQDVEAKIAELLQSTATANQVAAEARVATAEAHTAAEEAKLQQAALASSQAAQLPTTTTSTTVVDVVNLANETEETIKERIAQVSTERDKTLANLKPSEEAALKSQKQQYDIDAEANRVLNEKRKEIKKLVDEKKNYGRERRDIIRELGAKDQEITAATAPIEALKQAKLDAQTQVNFANEAINRIKRTAEIKSLDEEKKTLTEQADLIKAEINAAGQDAGLLFAANAKGLLNISLLGQVQDQIDQINQDVGTKAAAIASLEADKAQLEATLNSNTQALNAQMALLSQLEIESTFIRQRSEKKQAEIDRVSDSLVKNKEELADLEQEFQFKQLEAKVDVTRAVAQLTEGKALVERLNAQVATFQAHEASLRAAREKLEQEAERARLEAEAAKVEAERLEAERVRLERRNKRLEEVKIFRDLTFVDSKECKETTLYSQFNDFVDNQTTNLFKPTKSAKDLADFITHCAQGGNKLSNLGSLHNTVQAEIQASVAKLTKQVTDFGPRFRGVNTRFTTEISKAVRISQDIDALNTLKGVYEDILGTYKRTKEAWDAYDGKQKTTSDLREFTTALNTKIREKTKLAKKPSLSLPPAIDFPKQPSQVTLIENKLEEIKTTFERLVEDTKTKIEAKHQEGVDELLAKKEAIDNLQRELAELYAERSEIIKQILNEEPGNLTFGGVNLVKYGAKKLAASEAVIKMDPVLWANLSKGN